MNRHRWIVGVFVALLLIGCERPSAYESQFRDSVSIHFPPGHPYKDVEPLRARVDEMLRSREVGFWSGVMGSGEKMDIDHISLDLDFELVDEAKLVQSLIDEGLIPMDVEIEYHSEKPDAMIESE